MLIGLAGLKGSGKDTVAKYLVKHYGFHADSFAAPIRKFTCELLGVTPDQLESQKEETSWLGVTPRHIMQTFGTEWGRSMVHPDIWMSACMRRITPLRERGAHIVISDVRFENEARLIREHCGRMIQLTGRGLTGDGHVSEKGISAGLVDYTVSNADSMAALYQRIDRVMAACGVLKLSAMQMPQRPQMPPNRLVHERFPGTETLMAIKRLLREKSALWFLSITAIVVCFGVVAGCGIWIKNAEIFHPDQYAHRAWIGYTATVISVVIALLAASYIKHDR